MKKMFGTGLVFACILFSQIAYACSCTQQTNAGFVHATTKVLPQNAKGVLFLKQFNADIIYFEEPRIGIISRRQPIQISANDFEIRIGESREKVAVAIQSLQQFDSNANSEIAFYTFRTDKLERDFLRKKSQNASIKKLIKQKHISRSSTENFGNLIRVSPINGFKIGQTYSFRYLGKTSDWTYPTSMEVTINDENVDAQESRPRLQADGEAQLEALAQATGSGSCSSTQVSQVQRLSFRLDSQMEKYKDALMLFPKTNIARPTPYFMVPEIDFHHRSICSQPKYGKTSSSDQHEILVARCGIEPQEVVVNALVGFLEVEDKLTESNSVNVTFKKIPVESCNGFQLLNEALNTNNITQVKANLCALPMEESRWDSGGSPPVSLPNVNAIWNLRNWLNAEEKSCLTTFLERVVIESKETPNEALAYYKDSLLPLLSSTDLREISQAQQSFDNLNFGLSITVRDSIRNNNRKQILLNTLKSELLNLIETGSVPQSETAGHFLGELANADQEVIDRLFRISRQDHDRARAATRTLARLVPEDPQLQEILLEQIKEPSLLENASLLYADVAGKQNPQKAVDFLIKSSIAGSREALSRLPEFKDYADTAIPPLVELLSHEDNELRNDAFRILTQLYRGQSEIIHALKQSIRIDRDQAEPPFPIYCLYDLGDGINLLKPEIEYLSSLKMSDFDKDSLKSLIMKLNISKREKNRIVKNLNGTATIKD